MTSSNTNVVRKAEQDKRNDVALLPPVNVFEDASGITLMADLPGVPKENLQLHIEANTLTISGEVQLKSPEGLEPTHAEVGVPRYRRIFTLSKELDGEKVKAEFNAGVLKLHIPKAEHAKPRKIEVSVH
jgi:HSP20 family molecular chaperone IbpA